MLQFFMGTTIGILIGITLSALLAMAEYQERIEHERKNDTEISSD